MTISFTSNGTTSQILHNGTVVHNITAGGLQNLGVSNLATEAKPLGVDQTWQDVTASRVLNTTYTNNSGRTISVLLTCTLTNAVNEGFYVSGVRVAAQSQSGASFGWLFSVIVPNGSTYRFSGTSIQLWSELR